MNEAGRSFIFFMKKIAFIFEPIPAFAALIEAAGGVSDVLYEKFHLHL